MEIGLNRKDPEKKKKDEADKGAPNGFFQSDEKEPSRQKSQKEQGKCGGRGVKFETAETKTKGVGDEYGNERKAERLTHLNPKRNWNIGIVGSTSMQSANFKMQNAKRSPFFLRFP